LRTIVLGGTRFIGLALVEELLSAGHEVVVVHRGEHEPEGLPDVEHVHVHRRALEPGQLARLGAEALVDMSCMTADDAALALEAAGREMRLVVASSMDVYRAFGALWAETVTDAMPLTEESPLRDGPPPDREYVADGYDYDPREYEKLDVERAYLARGGTVCRLPMVYGPHDYKRREAIVLDRLDDGKIPVGAGGFLWSRGYAPELARGLRLALERPGDVFNLCEAECAPVRLWMEQIAAAAGREVEFVRVPDAELPEDLEIAGDIAQHVMAVPLKAERVLGWVHADPITCVRESVAWHLDHPPGGQR
jgi:nucleoside-diphosphate-sugar epimerase